jgi:hypothetical protein
MAFQLARWYRFADNSEVSAVFLLINAGAAREAATKFRWSDIFQYHDGRPLYFSI